MCALPACRQNIFAPAVDAQKPPVGAPVSLTPASSLQINVGFNAAADKVRCCLFQAVFLPTQHILGNRPGMSLLICSNTKSKTLLLRRRQPRLSQLETRSVSSDLCIPARRD